MMAGSSLWPAHPQPLPDELLTSWIVRTAEANGIKLQTLSRLLFGTSVSPWNRDCDRSAPKWILEPICEHTGIDYGKAYGMTLGVYEGLLYMRRRKSGQLRWILAVKTTATSRRGFGQQFCPQCLAEDQAPYFRKIWRVAFCTFCPEHGIMLYDACPSCGRPVVFHRRDFGKELENAGSICCCTECGFDFRQAAKNQANLPTRDVEELFCDMLAFVSGARRGAQGFDLGFFAVLHQLCRIMGMKGNGCRLRFFTAARLGLPVEPITLGRTAVEHRRVSIRHELMLCALWLMGNLQERVAAAWEAKAVRYNLLLKDMADAPLWYVRLAAGFSDWRHGMRFVR